MHPFNVICIHYPTPLDIQSILFTNIVNSLLSHNLKYKYFVDYISLLITNITGYGYIMYILVIIIHFLLINNIFRRKYHGIFV